MRLLDDRNRRRFRSRQGRTRWELAREHRQPIGFWRPPPPDSPEFEEFVAELVAEIKAKARPLTSEEVDPPPDDFER